MGSSVKCSAAKFSLGPLLFLIFVNDLPHWIRNSMILMFVDDTKLTCKILDENDGSLLQQDLDRLLEWTKYWHLDFSVDKMQGHASWT